MTDANTGRLMQTSDRIMVALNLRLDL